MSSEEVAEFIGMFRAVKWGTKSHEGQILAGGAIYCNKAFHN